jgi:flagellar basal-body rod modification protein FlgD
MASQVNSLSSTLAGTAASGAVTSTVQSEIADQAVSKEMFLKLLVAQIRNQNPLAPADGIQFLTQLAQFSELEQLITIRQDLDAIRSAAEAAGTGQTTAAGSADSQGK